MIDFLPQRRSQRIRTNIFIALGVLFVFALTVRVALDPDLGWHIRDGEYLLTHQWRVPAFDQFTHTMANYPVIMHEWVTDIGMYLISTKLGLAALSVIFAGITTLAFWIAANAANRKTARRESAVIAMVIGSIASTSIVGARAQMLTLLGLALLMTIIWEYRHNPMTRKIWWLPVLFLVWVNLHGGFASGLIFLAAYLGVTGLAVIWQRLRQGPAWTHRAELEATMWFRLFGASVLAVLVTLINPYGWRVYIEIVTTLADPFLRANIKEWVAVPLTDSGTVSLLVYLGLLAIFSALTYKKQDWRYVFVVAVFVYLGFRSWRNVPIVIIVSLPLWAAIVQSLSGEALKRLAPKTVVLVLLAVATSVLGYRQFNLLAQYGRSPATLANLPEFQYPYKAVQYLKANPPAGKMFNDYNWGGYLIWQYSEQKVFIDGRTPSWRINNRHTFKDHQIIVQAQGNWRELLRAYQVDWVIVHSNSLLGFALSGEPDWARVYDDGLATIFVRHK